MVRGAAPGRGTRRGAAAAGTRPQAESDNVNTSQPADGSTAAASAPVASRTTAGAAATATTIRRGAPATRGGSVARFRPKNVRRDQADRDRLALEEQKLANEQAAAAERLARGRSRFRSKRSRGDTMGSRGGRGITTASGPFSSGFGGSGSSRSGGWFGGGGGGGGGGSSSTGFQSFKSESKSKPGFGFAYSGPRETRINADKLHAHTPDDELDSDDEAMMVALSGQSASVLPMGIYRKEHKETGVVVATTAELEAAENANGEEESLWVEGDGSGALPPADQPEDDGIWDKAAGKAVAVKMEPGLEDSMDLDAAVQAAEQDTKQDTKPIIATKPKKLLPQDPEERMIQSDLALLAGELGAITITENGEDKTEAPSNKDGRMYLFQFPPLLPPLKQTAAPKPATKVKAEQDTLDVLSIPPSTTNTEPIDVTDEVADEDGALLAEDDIDYPEGFRSQALPQGGLVGKLVVRKSGKVELDWGGQTLEMSPAAGMNFLTSAVIVEEKDEKPQPGVIGGESIGMGKIMGRFVLAPIWSEEDDWNVAPEELVAS